MKICVNCGSEFRSCTEVEYILCSDCEKEMEYQEFLQGQYDNCIEEYQMEY